MELSPQQIRGVSFKVVKKGYDPDEVEAFKDDVASVVEASNNQAIAMEARARAAVSKLHELSQSAPAPEREREREPEGFSASDNDRITRTLALAQRTADNAVAEARAESESILAKARDEAERHLENARSLASKTIEDSRAEARRAVEGDRIQAENELQSLLARRDFLLSDVDHLEQFLQAQRERLRDTAGALQEIVERVPAGLGEIRRPLLSASADHAGATSHYEPTISPVSARQEAIAEIETATEPEIKTEPASTSSSTFDDTDDVVAVRELDVFDQEDGLDDEPVEELSELVWDDASIAAAERATELPFRPSGGPPQRPGSIRPQANVRRGAASTPPFNDPLEQDSVWRLLDEEVANTQAAEAGLNLDEDTTEVPIIPRAADTFRVGGDELQ